MDPTFSMNWPLLKNSLLVSTLATLLAVCLGFLTALVPSAVLFARHGTAARKMGIPFAPFLALGGIIALFAGKSLLDAYLSFLH